MYFIISKLVNSNISLILSNFPAKLVSKIQLNYFPSCFSSELSCAFAISAPFSMILKNQVYVLLLPSRAFASARLTRYSSVFDD